MAKMVGLSRNLKLSWLNEVAKLYSEGLSADQIKEQLNEYLSFEISSPTNLRKTREILMNIWVYDNEYSSRIKREAISLINKDPDYSFPVHWCMMLASYPVFQDMCRLIGKMDEFESAITTRQIKQKLFDEWGERSTLYHSVDKQIATMKAMGAIENVKTGVYSIKHHVISDSEMINFILQTIMTINDDGYYSISELENSQLLFPFQYKVNRESILEDERFEISSFGGKVVYKLR